MSDGPDRVPGETQHAEPVHESGPSRRAPAGVAGGVLAVQGAAGNRAAIAFVDSLQTKLEVGAVDDAAEIEADRVADHVVEVLRSPATDAPTDPPAIDAPPSIGLHRAPDGPTIGAAGGPVDADVERAITATRGGGRPLPDGIRGRMEGALGADLTDVRLHAGSEPTALSEKLQAKAFTVGNDIFFKGPAPDVEAPAGQHLLAHELTHVVQQGGGARRVVQRVIDVTAIKAEAKAANSSISRFKKSSMEPVFKAADAFNGAPDPLKLAVLKTEVDVLARDKAAKYGVAVGSLEGAMKAEMRTFVDRADPWVGVRDEIRASSDETESCFALCDNGLQKGKVLYRLGGDKDWKQQTMATYGITSNDSREALVKLGVFETGTAGHKQGPEVDELINTKLTKFVEKNLETRGKITGRVAVVGTADWEVIGEDEYGAATWVTKRNTLNAFVDRSSDPPRVFVNKDRGNAGTAIHEACHMWGDPGRPINAICHSLNEGVTEYFARKVCSSLTPPIPRTVYAKEFNIANKLVATIGEDAVGSAFFDGDIAAMSEPFGAKRWANFIDHIENDRYGSAEKVLEKVTKQSGLDDEPADTDLASLFG